MVVKITKETWEKCDIKTIYYFNKEKGMLELWLKMGDIEVKLGHSNIADVVLKESENTAAKKTKNIEEKKKKYKTFFEGEKGVFIIERLIHKDIFACLFSIRNIISLSCHEQVCLSALRFERDYLSKRSPLKHTCS